MGKQIVFLAIILGSINPQFIWGQLCDHCFEVEVFQNNQKLEIKNNIVQLQKLPFEIHVITEQPQGIVINTCLSDSNIVSLQKGTPLNDMEFFLYGMAEDMFNPDQEILIHSHAPSYWYYDDSLNHRFSKVEIESNRIIGIRRIAQMTNIETDEILSPQKFPESLYLGFIAVQWIPEKSTHIEFERKPLTLRFNL
jgi:hypothetical protein